MEDQSGHSGRSSPMVNHLQLSHTEGRPSLSTHNTPRNLNHMDGDTMTQLSEHCPITSSQSFLYFSPPVKQSTSGRRVSQGKLFCLSHCELYDNELSVNL